jgi:hypothetical protein
MYSVLLCMAVYSASSSPHWYPYKLSLMQPYRSKTGCALGHSARVGTAMLWRNNSSDIFLAE